MLVFTTPHEITNTSGGHQNPWNLPDLKHTVMLSAAIREHTTAAAASKKENGAWEEGRHVNACVCCSHHPHAERLKNDALAASKAVGDAMVESLNRE